MSSVIKPTTKPTVTRTDSGRYLIGNLPPTFANADDAVLVYAELIRRIGHIEQAAAQVKKLKDVAG
jgi:hypothetical protein